MINLIKAEYYKMWKDRSLLVLSLFMMIPIAFALMIYFDFSGLKIADGAFNIYTFPNNIWQFSVGTTLPLIVLAYLSSSLGREIKNGSITYQVTRVANRKEIIKAKLFTIISFNMIYYLLFNLVAIMSYGLFIAQTRFGASGRLDSEVKQQLIVSFMAVLLQIFMCVCALLISIKLSTIGIVVLTFIMTMVLSFLSTLGGMSYYLPGSIFYATNSIPDEIFTKLFWIQSLTLVVLLCIVYVAIQRVFMKLAL